MSAPRFIKNYYNACPFLNDRQEPFGSSSYNVFLSVWVLLVRAVKRAQQQSSRAHKIFKPKIITSILKLCTRDLTRQPFVYPFCSPWRHTSSFHHHFLNLGVLNNIREGHNFKYTYNMPFEFQIPTFFIPACALHS